MLRDYATLIEIAKIAKDFDATLQALIPLNQKRYETVKEDQVRLRRLLKKIRI